MLPSSFATTSVSPVSVQVAATAASTTAVCPVAGITSCPERIALQTEQCVPEVSPASVQVAGTSSSSTGVCPLASIASVLVAPHLVPVYYDFRLVNSFGEYFDGVNLLSVSELQKYTLIKVFNFSIILLSFLSHVKIL